MFKSLFISKNPGELGALQAFATENDYQLIAHSFLEFSPRPFSIDPSFDVLFFGSPRAVMFFKSQLDIPKDTAIACVGEKTELLLTSLGHPVDFSGSGKGSITEVADAFAKWVGERKVLFPVSSMSLGTFPKRLSEAQRQIVACYQTDVKGRRIATCDIYVFTSPSNVEGFLLENELPDDALIIAWGESTGNALQLAGSESFTVLSSPDIDCLIETILKEA